MKIYQRTTCSAPFREVAKETFPNLESKPAYWRFLQYLIFGTFFDEDTKRLVIPQDVIAEIEGKSDEIKNYHAGKFLSAFQADVMSQDTFQWSGWRKDKCRQVTKCDFPIHFAEAIDNEWQNLNHAQ